MNPKPHKDFSEDHNLKKVGGVNGVIWRSMENDIKALKISFVTGILSALVLLCYHHQARIVLACSGGMMGGDDFSSSDSSDYSSCDDSYSWSRPSRPVTDPVKGANEVRANLSNVDPSPKSVVKLQVGSLNTDRSLQKELNRIAQSADTSTSKGWKFVLQKSVLSLLQHSSYCVSGHSSVDVKWSAEGCKKVFYKLSIEERNKFDEVTLVNVNSIRKKSETSQSSNELPDGYIVVTIIVAARGVPELPPIQSNAQLKEALHKLASIPSSDIMAAQVLWTPQKEDDSLSEQKMREDYPLMHSL
ncbi:FLUCTUATING-LIGHT-ACCLIMATION protein 1, chloroplastic-like [Bidens hawaiensis]|uniref:FLUCTUATING-LIGHT-ACCLIMATION protein 1, chloroplastic-like n=1 Tax=Bidens hawaiensis TaxID=980011 RepID=UPI0040491954